MFEIDVCISIRIRMAPRCHMMSGVVEKDTEHHLPVLAVHSLLSPNCGAQVKALRARGQAGRQLQGPALSE